MKETAEGSERDEESTERYVQALDMIVRGNVQISQVFLESAVMDTMGLRMEDKPADFPKNEELLRKTLNLSKNVRKERGLRNVYVMPQRYKVALEAVVPENEIG